MACGERGADVWCLACMSVAATFRWRDCPPRPPGLDAVMVNYRYQGLVADAIVAGKLGGRHAVWRPFGRRLGRPDDVDVIVPVPTEPGRRRRRGFDHTALLAAGLADVTGLPVLAAVASRPGASDRGRANSERHNGEAGARSPWVAIAGLDGARVALVDDVTTTGTTLAGTARACRDAGAVSVVASVVSAAPGRVAGTW